MEKDKQQLLNSITFDFIDDVYIGGEIIIHQLEGDVPAVFENYVYINEDTKDYGGIYLTDGSDDNSGTR